MNINTFHFRIIVLLFSSLLLTTKQSNAQAWQWARQAGNNGHDNICFATAADNHGAVYSAGYFGGDSIVFGATTLHNNNAAQKVFYLAKYDSLGNVIWARGAGKGENYIKALATDAAGNIYVAGSFTEDTLTLGTDVLVNDSAAWGYKIFIAKYNSTGNVVWARTPPCIDTTHAVATGITTDAAGNVYVTGFFNSRKMIFGSDTMRNLQPRFYDVFLARYDSSGNAVWGKQTTGNDMGSINSVVKTDNHNNVYIGGNITMATIAFGTDTFTSYGPNSFLAKYNASGSEIWAKMPTGGSNNRISAIHTDAQGQILATGDFVDDMIWGTDTLTDPISYSGGASNLFLLKFDTTGTVMWHQQVATGFTGARAMAADKAGNIYVTGYFDVTLVSPIDTMIAGTDTFINQGRSDILIAMYNSAGVRQWMQTLGGIYWEIGMGLCMDTATSSIYMGGYVNSPTLTIGSDVLGCPSVFTNAILARMPVPRPLGVNDVLAQNNSVSIYPNPTSADLVIASSNPISDITITNIMGQVVYSSHIRERTLLQNIDVIALSPGVYILKADGITQKFVKL